jgi:chromosome segregation ATPase
MDRETGPDDRGIFYIYSGRCIVSHISHEKKLEVARLYLLGYTYEKIEEESKVSHGSIANIVKELLAGKLIIPGVPADKVNDLHQLSIVLVKKGLDPSQALLGITLFERFSELGIEPSQLDRWSEQVELYAPEDITAKDFFQAALHLHELEEAEGKPFQEFEQEYIGMQQKMVEMGSEVDSLYEKKEGLAGEVESLKSEVGTLKNEREEIKSAVEAESAELEQAESVVTSAKEERAQLEVEIEKLKKKRDELNLEVGAKEQSLEKLKKIGLSEEDLLHLSNLVEAMAEKENIDADQVKDEFFSALGQFVTFSGLKKATQEKAKELEDMAEQKASLTGEVVELKSRRAALKAEVSQSASAAAEQIKEAGEEAVSAIQQEADAIREEVKSILGDVLDAGLAVGEMRGMLKQGEEAGKELEELVEKIQHQLKDKK